MANTFPICSIPVKIFNQFANFHDQFLQSVWVDHFPVNFLSVFHYFGWFQPKIHFQFQKTNLLQFPTNFILTNSSQFSVGFFRFQSFKNPFGASSIGANQKWSTHFQFAQFRSKSLTNLPIFMTNFCNRFRLMLLQSIFDKFFISLVNFSQKFISNLKKNKQIFSNFLPIFFDQFKSIFG